MQMSPAPETISAMLVVETLLYALQYCQMAFYKSFNSERNAEKHSTSILHRHICQARKLKVYIDVT